MTINDDKVIVQIFDRETGKMMTEPPGVAENLLVDLSRQCVADSQRWFPSISPSENDTVRQTVTRVIHHTVAMFGEVGEFANIVKKIERGSLRLTDPNTRHDLGDELVDVLIYLLNIAGILKFDLLAGYNDKRQFNEERFGSDNA